MNRIDKNLNNYNQQRIGFKADGTPAVSAPAVKLPDMYYMPDSFEKPMTLAESIKKVDMMGLVSPWFENPLAMLGLCGGMSIGIDAIEKTFNKEYEKSSLGKIAKFGDKIENSGFIKSGPMQTVLGGIKKGWGAISNFALKNSVIRAMVKTPSQPKFKMPKSELETVEQRTVEKFREILNISRLHDNGAILEQHPWRFEEIAATKAEKEELKQFFNVRNLSEVEDSKLVNRLTLKRLGKSEAEISAIMNGAEPWKATVKEIINARGLTEADIKTIMESNGKKAIKLSAQASENLKALKFTKGNKWLPKIPFVSKLFSNTTGFGETHNKFHSMLHSTKTGKFFSKFLQQTYRGFTFGNGKLGVMFWVAPFLYQGIKNTRKAEKDEKVGTFAKGLIDSISWVFVFPIVLKGIHALGGIQYAGMSTHQAKNEVKWIEDFNKEAAKGGKYFGNKDLYKEKLGELNERIKANRVVEGQSLFVRTLRKISRFTKADLNKIMPYQSGNKFADFMRRLPRWHGRYGFFYSFARFLVFMAVGMPLVDKVIEKITAKIFGRSRDEFKEQEYEEAKKAQEEYTIKDLKERMLEIQAGKMNPRAEIQNVVQPASVNPMPIVETPVEQQSIKNPYENIQVNRTTVEQKAVNAMPEVKKRDNYTYIPSQDSVFDKETGKNPAQSVNKYIPAQTPINVTKNFDNSAIEAAMRKASRAEQRALQTLAGNFGSSQ